MINNADIRKTKKAYVEWVDSCAYRGWQSGKEMAKETYSKIVSIGFVISEDKQRIALTNSISDSGNVNDILFIPIVAITKKRYFK